VSPDGHTLDIAYMARPGAEEIQPVPPPAGVELRDRPGDGPVHCAGPGGASDNPLCEDAEAILNRTAAKIICR